MSAIRAERVNNLTSRDPDYITPEIKAMLRRNNMLMHGGRVEEAGTLLRHTGKKTTWRCQSWLTKLDNKTNAKDVWATV